MGALVPLETAREAWREACRLGALDRGLLTRGAEAFPDPRPAPESGLAGMCAAPLAARWAGRSARRTSGGVLRSAAVLGAWGESGEGWEPAQGFSLWGAWDDPLLRGAGRRNPWVPLAHPVAPNAPRGGPPLAPHVAVQGRHRASRRDG